MIKNTEMNIKENSETAEGPSEIIMRGEDHGGVSHRILNNEMTAPLSHIVHDAIQETI
jgi:hypothetical protein